jgi:hypothetical protein
MSMHASRRCFSLRGVRPKCDTLHAPGACHPPGSRLWEQSSSGPLGHNFCRKRNCFQIAFSFPAQRLVTT